jgi:glycosyltransferase involved in cell wall biosynthesis
MTDLAQGSDAPTAEPESRARPRLAVLIPVFNDQPGLEKALASLALDGAQFDVFVVDDGSDPPIIFPPGLPYVVRLVRQEPNQGITAALNAGLRLICAAGYEYVARLDAGDLSLPGRFAAQMGFLDLHPDHAAVGASARYVDLSGNRLFDFQPPGDHEALLRLYRYRSGIVHPSAMIRVAALLACGFYREKFPGGEDYDLFMRLSRAHKLGNLSPIFVVKEVRPGSITSKRLSIRISRINLLRHYFDPWSIHSYLGIAFNTCLMFAPFALVWRAKGLAKVGSSRRKGNGPDSACPTIT